MSDVVKLVQPETNNVLRLLDTGGLNFSKEEAALVEELEGHRYFLLCKVPGHGLCGLLHMAYTTALMVDLNECGYVDRYCYKTGTEAVRALLAWDGDGEPQDYIVKKD